MARSPSAPAAARRDFLFTTWQGGGNVAPALTAALRLLARGHRVRVMSDSCDRADVEAIGAEFLPWRHAPSRPDRSAASDTIRDWDAASPPEKIARLRDNILCGPALAYARDVIDELDRRPADLVVSSELILGPAVACEARRQPLAFLATNLSILPIPGIPPFGPGFLPARDAAEARLHAEVAAGAWAMMDEGLGAVNAARFALGLKPLAGLREQYDVARRMLLATSRAFDFPAETLPEFFRYVGPLLGEPGWAEPWASPWPEKDTRPLVLVAFSTTFQDQGALVQAALDAVGGLPGLRALVTLGPALDGAGLRAPGNAVLRRSAPHGAVMREAAAVVTHGGHGTVMRALAHRLPLLVVPMGRDQDDNAVRVTARGAGLSLAPAEASAGAIRAALRHLIEDPAFRDAARLLGDAVAAEAASPAVVEELEALAGEGAAPAAAAA